MPSRRLTPSPAVQTRSATREAAPPRAIGFWIESLRDQACLPPQEFVGECSAEQRQRVADYLDRGAISETFQGGMWCRFGCPFRKDVELTDGHWLWPGDLGHYVRDHGVILPPEFVSHVESAAPPLPREQWCAEKPDFQWWTQWCRAHRSGAYRERLAIARQHADAEYSRRLIQMASDLEAKEGLSDTRCQWQGCDRRALSRRVLCAACSLKGTQSEADRVYRTGLREVLISR